MSCCLNAGNSVACEQAFLLGERSGSRENARASDPSLARSREAGVLARRLGTVIKD